jgi:hypothetical protein
MIGVAMGESVGALFNPLNLSRHSSESWNLTAFDAEGGKRFQLSLE